MKNIIFLGETKDFSDRWLIYTLSKYYRITLVDITATEILDAPKNCQVLINRVYASSIQRLGKKKIFKFMRSVGYMKQKGIAIINSPKGYELDISRKKQSYFFRKKTFPFIKTLYVKQALLNKHKVAPPYILKYNTSGRNKKLQIIRNKKDFLNIANGSKIDSVIQPFVNKSICFRTEFVGDWNSTFTQHIYLTKNHLKFDYTYNIIPTPLPEPFIKKLCKTLNGIGVQAFSVEYFMERGNLLNIIDFNLTSNYPRFFVKNLEDELKKAWLNLIKNATI